MATICYAWDDAPFIIEKIIVGGAGGMQSLKRVRERLKTLTEDEKIVLINLFVRLNVDEIVFEQRMNKQKNKKVKIKLKDIEVTTRQQKNINVNVNFKDKDIY